MLFTDGDLLTAADLAALDAEVPEVAAAEGLIVDGEGSIVRQAWQECADELLGRMEGFGGHWVHSAGSGGVRSRMHLTQIVATDPYAHKLSAVQRWVLYQALVLFYRAATNRTLSDRHAAKMAQYEGDAKQHWKRLWARGLPVVWRPLPCPGALHEWNSGAWGTGNVTSVSGGSGPERTYTVAITWVDTDEYSSAASKGNAESGPSRIVAFTLPEDELLRVNIGNLRPPDGAPSTHTAADGGFQTMVASGWNVYVGDVDGPLYLQNGFPIPIGTTQYTFAAAPALGGAVLDPGQRPDTNTRFQNVLQRG